MLRLSPIVTITGLVSNSENAQHISDAKDMIALTYQKSA